MKDKNLIEGIRKAHEVLMMCPDALDVALGDARAGYAYAYVNKTKEAVKVRNEARTILWQTWQAGAYSFSEISQMLRVDELAVKAALDPEWRQEMGIE